MHNVKIDEGASMDEKKATGPSRQISRAAFLIEEKLSMVFLGKGDGPCGFT